MKFLHQVEEENKQTEETKEAERKAKELMDRLEKLCKEVGGDWDFINYFHTYEATCKLPSPQRGGISTYTSEGRPAEKGRKFLLDFWVSEKELPNYEIKVPRKISKIEVPSWTTISFYSERITGSVSLNQSTQTVGVLSLENISKFWFRVDKAYSRLEIALF